MKPLIFCILFFGISAISFGSEGAFLYAQPDTVPPPPPGGPLALAGPETACLGETSLYTTEAPLASTCQWTVDGVIYPDTTASFSVTWTETGNHVVSVSFLGAGGQFTEPQSVTTYTGTAPPAPIQGPAQVCQGVQEMFFTTVGPGEVCHWLVDGVLQPTTAPVLYFTFMQPGPHVVEVSADGPCGAGESVSLNVIAFQLPEVFLGNDTTLQPGQTLLLDAGNPGASFLWNTGATTQTIVVSATGNYSVEVTTPCGTDSDEIAVTILVSVPEPGTITWDLMVSGRKYLFTEPGGKPDHLQVIDLQGRSVYSGNPEEIADLPLKGVYLIRWHAKNEVFTKKILIP